METEVKDAPATVAVRAGTAWLPPSMGAALECAADEAGRFALQGVQVSTVGGGLTVTATDGRRMMRAVYGECESPGDPLRVLLPPDALAFLTTASKALRRDPRAQPTDRVVVLTVAEEPTGRRLLTLACALTGAQLVTREIDGSFPVVDDAIPKPEPVSGFVSLGEPLLAGLLKSMRGMAGAPKDRLAVRFCCRGPKAPVRLDYEAEGVAVVGVLMPAASSV